MKFLARLKKKSSIKAFWMWCSLIRPRMILMPTFWSELVTCERGSRPGLDFKDERSTNVGHRSWWTETVDPSFDREIHQPEPENQNGVRQTGSQEVTDQEKRTHRFPPLHYKKHPLPDPIHANQKSDNCAQSKSDPTNRTWDPIDSDRRPLRFDF